MHLNRRHILLILLIIAGLSIFLPIPVRYSFKVTAKVYPVREWKLCRGAEEGLWSETYNYETDALSDFKNYRFERGDIAELRINNNIPFDTLVNKNDTIACIESYFIENEITRLTSLRDIEMANMNVVTTGEKSALVEQAQRQYNYALQQYDLEKKNFSRQERLFRDSVITQAEFDIHENTLKLAEINTQVAYDGLMALTTGEKDPVVKLSDQTIQSYEKEIQRLQLQKDQYTITTPIAGWLGYDPGSGYDPLLGIVPETGSILRVSDISSLVLKIPIVYEQSSYLSQLHSVTISTPDNKYSLNATFKGFVENVNFIQSRQVIIAKAVTEEFSRGIYPGMLLKCRIYCDRVSLLEYLRRNFALSF
jgi:hypothetical protein